ncbi:MAG: SpoIIE family protein phosphatase [Ruminiclostridium sp.]|nr:SpoIIE family protein phosphatase [Ruminiclostridium sp.]
MNEKRRHPIRKRINKTVLLITAVSLIITSVFSIISMISIQRKAEDALTQQSMDNLQEVIREKTLLADQRLRKYAEITRDLAYYAEEIINNPENYKPHAFPYPVNPDNAGDLTIQVAMAYEDMKWEDVRDIAELYANVEPRFYPVMTQNSDVITTIYFGTTTADVIVCYDVQSDVKAGMLYYNFYETSWYKLCEEKKDLAFTNVYPDGFGRGMTITCVCPLHDKKGNICGIIGVDILINDLYSEIIDLDLGEGTKVLVADENNDLISPDEEVSGTDMTEGRDIDRSYIERASSYPSGIIAKEGRILAFDTIESAGWKVFVSIPQSSVLELANTINQDIVTSIIMFIVFFLIIMTVVVLGIYALSGTITKPIIDLKKDVGEITGGNLDHRAKIKDNDEIGDLAESFNEMASSLKEHIDTITQVTAVKERMTAELKVATKIQADMLPKNFPKRDDIELFASMTPAREMGGDFYDFFMIDDDRMGLVIADVSGKGVPAAMFMIVARTLIKIHTTIPGKPSQMLWDINNTLCADNPSGLFITAWFGILTLSTGELISSNAGHEYPALMHEDGDYELLEGENMPPLATVENIEYTDEIITLRKGDKLFLYTDGVPEAKSMDGKRFGLDNLLDVLNSNRSAGPEELLDSIKREVDAFNGDKDPFDDVTMMSVVWKGEQE